ncbi:unnamed protein product, partial [Nesidiocoris tenuis]
NRFPNDFENGQNNHSSTKRPQVTVSAALFSKKRAQRKSHRNRKSFSTRKKRSHTSNSEAKPFVRKRVHGGRRTEYGVRGTAYGGRRTGMGDGVRRAAYERIFFYCRIGFSTL